MGNFAWSVVIQIAGAFAGAGTSVYYNFDRMQRRRKLAFTVGPIAGILVALGITIPISYAKITADMEMAGHFGYGILSLMLAGMFTTTIATFFQIESRPPQQR